MKRRTVARGIAMLLKTVGSQAAKIILDPFYLKNWRGPALILI